MKPLSTLALACSVFTLTGCPTVDTPTGTGAPGTPAAPGAQAQAGVDANGKPLDLMKIGPQDQVRFTDMAIAPNGALHAIYQSKDRRSYREQVYYVTSTDGGKTWSEPKNLLEDDTSSQAGFIRLAVDGAGRVYAFWKTFSGFDVVDQSGGNAGTLAYRVLDGGVWSAATIVGTPKEVVGWFPAVAPNGQLHVVWSEPPKGPDGRYEADWMAGLIQQATVTGATVNASTTVFQAPPVKVAEDVTHHDGYKGLSGYVDAGGTAHFSAIKIATTAEAGATASPTDIVFWNGMAWSTVLDAKKLEGVNDKVTTSPPVLWRDAQGRDHLLVLNQGLDKPALLDYSPVEAKTAPTPVYQIKATKSTYGQIFGFQAFPAADGKLTAFLEARDSDAAIFPFDLSAIPFDGGRWQAPINVTGNEARAQFASKAITFNTSANKLTTYSAKYGAGAYDRNGKLDVFFVNTEVVTIMDKTDSWRGTSGFIGSNSTTSAYFQQL